MKNAGTYSNYLVDKETELNVQFKMKSYDIFNMLCAKNAFRDVKVFTKCSSYLSKHVNQWIIAEPFAGVHNKENSNTLD